MGLNSLATILCPENVLKRADEKLLQCGGRPFGKEKELETLIQNIAQPVITKAAEKTPSDFYNKNVTVRTPEYQILGKAKAFTRGILQEQGTIYSNFAQGEDKEVLELVAEVICSTMINLCGEYFCQTFEEEQKQSTQQNEQSHL